MPRDLTAEVVFDASRFARALLCGVRLMACMLILFYATRFVGILLLGIRLTRFGRRCWAAFVPCLLRCV